MSSKERAFLVPLKQLIGRGLAWSLPILLASITLLCLPAIGHAQAPAQPTGLTPTNTSVTPGTQPTLSWSAANGATSYQIKFGTVNPPPLFAATSETSITLGTIIASNVTYYWQVVAVNSSGSTPSAIASFTGGTAGGLPPAVTVFTPANGTTNVDLNPTLMWGAVTADSYDVYFGTTNPPPPITNTTSTSFTPGTLVANQTYYWTVNPRNVNGATQSGVQVFSTGTTIGNGAPSPVTVVTPVSGTTNVPLNTTLTWQAPAGATSYNVSFGTTNPPPVVLMGTTSLSYPVSLAANTIYYWQVAAVNASGTTSSQVFSFSTGNSVTNSGALRFIPVTPCRVLDTRGNFGVFGGPMMPANSSRDVPITSGSCGIPTTAQAYSLNITAVPPGRLTFLTVWPSGQAQPNVSTLNSFDGRTVANAAIVPAGTNGSISMFASDATHVIIDIDGYFVPANTANSLPFNALTPCRVVDTRSNTLGVLGAPFMTGGSTRTFPLLSSSCGIPVSALAYSLNITVVPRTQLGFLTTWPTGQPQPPVSTLNSTDGATVANAAIVPAGSGGAINIFVSNDTDVIIDVNGYFGQPTGSSAQSNLSLYTLTPCRVVDTRGGFSGFFGPPPFVANSSRTIPMVGSCSVPSTAAAYSLNFTVVPPGPLGFITAWPEGQPQPAASTLNSSLGKVVANAALVPAGQAGAIDIYASNATDLILDINGYFAP